MYKIWSCYNWQLYTDDTNDNDANDGDDDDTNDNNNDTRQTNHDCIGSLECMPNEPKSTMMFHSWLYCPGDRQADWQISINWYVLWYDAFFTSLHAQCIWALLDFPAKSSSDTYMCFPKIPFCDSSSMPTPFMYLSIIITNYSLT